MLREPAESKDLFTMLASEDLIDRLTAIEVLGDIGDDEALRVLRTRLKRVNQELSALVIAVGKLKKRHQAACRKV
ncbi:MAG: hypothetical protein HY782_23065 [Chloroflexi bacterium]|nr:hypothetical protein [Chloroflexota bacterium]